MIKSIKIFCRVAAAIIIMMVVVPMFLSLLLQLNSIQRLILEKATTFISEKAGVEVSIKKIDIGKLYTLKVSGVYVQSAKGRDTLLAVDEVRARVATLKGLNKELALSTFTADGGQFNVYSSDSVVNVKMFVDKIRGNKNKEKGDFTISSKSVDIENFVFRFERREREEVSYGVNYQDMEATNLNISMQDFSMTADTIRAQMKDMNFKEKGGIRVEGLNIDSLYVSSNGMHFVNGNFTVNTSSEINFNRLAIDYHDWNMQEYVDSIHMKADVATSVVDMKTVARLTKKYRGWNSLIHFSGTFGGTVSSMEGHVRSAQILNSTLTDCKYYVYDITDFKKALFDFNISTLTTSAHDVVSVMSDFSGKDTTLPSIINAETSFVIGGYVVGELSDFDAECVISTLGDKGSITTNINVKEADFGVNLNGYLGVDSLQTAEVLHYDKLELVSLDLHTSGFLSTHNSSLAIEGDVNSLLYMGYDYNSLKLKGELRNSAFVGYMGCKDPNLDFEFNGTLDLSKDVPSYNFNLELEQANLALLGINKRDSVSLLRARVIADGRGSTLDDINASINIDKLRYVSPQDTTYATNAIVVEARNSANRKQISVNSEYFDLSLKGVHSYNALYAYVRKSLTRYVPALSRQKGYSSYVAQLEDEGNTLDNFYVVTLDVKEANNLASIIVPTLTLAKDSKLSFLFNPVADSFTLSVNSDNINLQNNSFYKLSLTAKNEGDKINLFARSEEMILGNIFIPNFSVIGTVENNVIGGDFGFSNPADNTYAIMKTRTTVSSKQGELNFKVDILPSSLNLYRDVWTSDNSSISIAPGRVTINDFSLKSTGQLLAIDGVISDNKEDTLKVVMDNFSFKPLNLLTSAAQIDLAGYMSGRVAFSALGGKESLYVDADIRFKDNEINGVSVPDARFFTLMNNETNMLDFTFDAGEEPFIYGYLSRLTNQYVARVTLPKFDVAVVAPFVSTIADGVSGEASVDVQIDNSRGYFAVNGEVLMPSVDARIIATNVQYNVSGRAEIRDNQYTLYDGKIKDLTGGSGTVTGHMSNVKYKRVKYELGVKTNNLLGLNTNEKLNSDFYGKIYGKGDVKILGDRNKIELNIEALPSARSTFVLPLGGNTLSEVSFIKFATKEEVIEGSGIIRRKKANTNTASLAMDMNLTATSLLETEIVMDPVTGSSLKATGNAKLNMNIQPGDEVFSIDGEYILDKGTYRFILPNFTIVDKSFNITEGSWMRWTGDALGATINVDAIYPVKASLAPLLGDDMTSRVDVDCVLQLRGELMNPEINLGIDTPNASPEEQSAIKNALNTQEEISTQIFYLLLSNSFFPTSGTVSAGNIGLMGTTTTGIEFLTNQINNILSGDKFNFGINYLPQSELSSNEFGIDFSAPIYSDRVFIDVAGNYNFMDNSSAVTTNQNNWSGDVYITWLLNNSGNVSLKAFTTTIDTFDENQGLQDSGVGIYFKTDFDSLSDLHLRYKEFLQKRRAKRKLKKEQKQSSKELDKNENQ